MSFSEGISFFSLDRPPSKNASFELMELRPLNIASSVKEFLAGLSLTDEELVRSRKNLTKNWLHRVRQVILQQDLMAFHG